MSKILKYSLITIGTLLVVLIAIVAFIVATFNPNDYKPLIIKLVKEKKQRTLLIPGDIKLTIFPKIGADLGKISISDHAASTEFASINSAKVSLALIPLLSKHLIVDHVMVDGLRAHIIRNKDGTTNFDDLISKEKSDEQIQFDIDSVQISHSTVVFDDLQQDRKSEIIDLNLDTGKIADGVKSKFDLQAHLKNSRPLADVVVDGSSGFMFDLQQKHYVLDGLDAEVKGSLADFTAANIRLKGNADLKLATMRFALEGISLAASGKRAAQGFDIKLDVPKLAVDDNSVSGDKVSGNAKLVEGARTITADFSLPSFQGSPQAFKIAALNLEASIKEAQLEAKAKITGAVTGDIDKLLFNSPQLKIAFDGKQDSNAISGTLTTPVSANMKAQMISAPQIAAAFTVPNPGGGLMKLRANGRVDVNLDKSTLSSALKGNIDDSVFDAKVGLSKFSPAAYTFDVGIDRIDVDHYLAKPAATSASKTPTAKAPETPIDLSALKTLNATGSMRIGALKVKDIKATNVKFDLRAINGKADINALSANLYGGSVAGSMAVTASTPPRFVIKQMLKNIHVGDLLKDAINKQPIDGNGDVQLDVSAQGATFSAIKKALNGTAKLELRDGAVHGINVAKAIRNAKAKIGELRGDEASQVGTASSEEKTDFSELTGSFKITNGVAHNDDLSMKSPLLRLGGDGNIDVGNERLDYLVKANIVSSLQGQGGPELQALKGLTVPVRLSGPFDAIGWKVDFEGLAKGLVQQKVDEKKDEVKQKFDDKKDELKQKAEDQLKDKLKGLFGR